MELWNCNDGQERDNRAQVALESDEDALYCDDDGGNDGNMRTIKCENYNYFANR